MTIDCSRHLQRLRRYQLMFRTSIGAGLLGLLLTAGGLLAWLVGPLPIVLPWGLLLTSASAALALKVAQSTANLLDASGQLRRQS